MKIIKTLEYKIHQHSARLDLRHQSFTKLLRAKRLLIRSLYPEQALDKAAGRSLAIVGTRRPSDYGKGCVAELIKSLSINFPCLNILSGGALGIDREVHVQALKYGLSTQSWV